DPVTEYEAGGSVTPSISLASAFAAVGAQAEVVGGGCAAFTGRYVAYSVVGVMAASSLIVTASCWRPPDGAPNCTLSFTAAAAVAAARSAEPTARSAEPTARSEVSRAGGLTAPTASHFGQDSGSPAPVLGAGLLLAGAIVGIAPSVTPPYVLGGLAGWAGCDGCCPEPWHPLSWMTAVLLPPPPPSVPEICEPSALLIDVKFAHSRAPPEPAILAVANPSSVVPCVPTPSKLPAARV